MSMKRKKDEYTEAHNRYYPLVFSSIYTKIENIEDTKDICQDIFIKFFEKFDEIENKRKWLYGALRLAVFEFYRKKKGSNNIENVFNGAGLTFVNSLRNARIVIGEAMEEVENFIDEDEKTLFDLIAQYNYSYSAVAKQLGFVQCVYQIYNFDCL